MLTIETTDGRTWFKPGELIEGRASWYLDEEMDAEGHIYAGKRAEEIILASRDYEATSIVMGTSAKSFVGALFSKSCSCRVGEGSDLPVLFIPFGER